MRVCVVFCTVRATKAFESYAANFRNYGHKPDIIVVDENGDTRRHIRESLDGFDIQFYGKRERRKWIREHKLDVDVVPAKTTDVIGFSLLTIKDHAYDMVVFADDDTYPEPATDYLAEHQANLFTRTMPTRESLNGWLNPYPPMFPRGYPYSLRKNHKAATTNTNHSHPILNMGLWLNVPDLNAVDYLYHGSLTGQYNHCGLLDRTSYILGSRYMPLSRMNLAFKPKIIPAFYQGTGEAYNVGRYGDVFSGLFLMKIAGHLGDCVSFGSPFCIHNKEPRDVFRDIRCECEAVKLNETMWRVLDKIELDGDSYAECYLDLADGLLKYKDEFHIPCYISHLTSQMREWVKAVEI